MMNTVQWFIQELAEHNSDFKNYITTEETEEFENQIKNFVQKSEGYVSVDCELQIEDRPLEISHIITDCKEEEPNDGKHNEEKNLIM